VAGDAHHEDAEEQRRDDDLDEAEKNRAQELKFHRDGGRIVAQPRAGEERCRDSDHYGDNCRGKKFIFHRRSTKDFIGAERYAG